jgi:hypothetical protein
MYVARIGIGGTIGIPRFESNPDSPGSPDKRVYENAGHTASAIAPLLSTCRFPCEVQSCSQISKKAISELLRELYRADGFAADYEFHAPVLLAPGSSVVRRDRVGFAETVY